MKTKKSQVLVIFGASGDLTKRKLIPALFELFRQNLLPDKFAVLGTSRTQLNDEEFRNKAVEFLPVSKTCETFKKKLYYQPVNTNLNDFELLNQRLEKICIQNKINNNYIFYLSTPPSLYEIIPEYLSKVGLSKSENYYRRLIDEKPFGTN